MTANSQNGLKDWLPKNGCYYKMKESRLYLIVTCFVIIYYHWSAVVSFCCNRPCRVWLFKFCTSNFITPCKLWNTPWCSEPSINQNVGWLWFHNNMLFKIILQCPLPNSWAAYGQCVSGDFVLLHQLVAELSRLFVIKQCLKMLNYALIVQRKLPVGRTPIWWKLCHLHPLMRYFGEWCHTIYITFYYWS